MSWARRRGHRWKLSAKELFVDHRFRIEMHSCKRFVSQNSNMIFFSKFGIWNVPFRCMHTKWIVEIHLHWDAAIEFALDYPERLKRYYFLGCDKIHRVLLSENFYIYHHPRMERKKKREDCRTMWCISTKCSACINHCLNLDFSSILFLTRRAEKE